MSDSILLKVLTYGILGIVLCAAYFYALQWNIRLYCERGPVWKALLVHLLRLVGIGAAFTVCARQGAVPLLSGFGGFVTIRTVTLHRQDYCSISDTLTKRADASPSSGREGHLSH